MLRRGDFYRATAYEREFETLLTLVFLSNSVRKGCKLSRQYGA